MNCFVEVSECVCRQVYVVGDERRRGLTRATKVRVERERERERVARDSYAADMKEK